MRVFNKLTLPAIGAGLAAMVLAEPAAAQAEGVTPETAYVLTTFSFLMFGALVMWMAAGFTMLETGLVRSKNTAVICLKNISLFSVAALMFFLVGYDMMYPSNNPLGVFSLTNFGFGYGEQNPEIALLGGNNNPAILASVIDSEYSRMSGWFYQMVFVATAASIISGTVAERIKVGPFLIFIAVMAGVLYPTAGEWVWGNGWLASMGFKDFAGGTVVHSLGGWCALTGAIILGARKGKFESGGIINTLPAANLSLATLGTLILWFGWYGFNAGSHALLASAADASWMAMIYTNTTLAAAAGVVTAMMARYLFVGRMELGFVLNGAIGGLVAITAGPDLVNPVFAIFIGSIGAILVVISIPMLERMRVDDVVGAIPAHLVAGVWGTLAVGIFGGGTLWVQFVGAAAVAAFAIVASTVVWLVLKFTVGIRVSEQLELAGMDSADFDMENLAAGRKTAMERDAFPELGPSAR